MFLLCSHSVNHENSHLCVQRFLVRDKWLHFVLLVICFSDTLQLWEISISWYLSTFCGRADAEAEAPIHWPPDAKSQLVGKDPDAGKDWRQEEKGMTEDEMVGWHHWLYGHEFEQAPGIGDEQGNMVCCKESDTTEWLNWTKLINILGID